MFFGTYTPRLDDKGRLFLPAKFRDELAEGLVITRGQERCLDVWTRADFGGSPSSCARRRSPTRAARDYSRMLFAGASRRDAGQAGPGHAPAELREYAGLDARTAS